MSFWPYLLDKLIMNPVDAACRYAPSREAVVMLARARTVAQAGAVCPLDALAVVIMVNLLVQALFVHSRRNSRTVSQVRRHTHVDTCGLGSASLRPAKLSSIRHGKHQAAYVFEDAILRVAVYGSTNSP